MNKIEELEQKIHAEINNLTEKFDKEISELKEKQENQEWIPQYLEAYWYINLDMMITVQCTWYNREIDNIRLQHKVIFKTKDKAEEYLEYLQAKEKAMNEFSKAEWENKLITKCRFYYDYEYNDFRVVDAYIAKHINGMYFRTEESAQEFINKYEKFMKRELGI